MGSKCTDKAAVHAHCWSKRFSQPSQRQYFRAERLRENTCQALDASIERKVDHPRNKEIAQLTPANGAMALR